MKRKRRSKEEFHKLDQARDSLALVNLPPKQGGKKKYFSEDYQYLNFLDDHSWNKRGHFNDTSSSEVVNIDEEVLRDQKIFPMWRRSKKKRRGFFPDEDDEEEEEDSEVQKLLIKNTEANKLLHQSYGIN